ncbi:hypothetical protein NCCP2222_06770 [Sporosarcina sp. NCCP-2222]|nr:hypothetical protein [Sporosarcina sp. NCCP-2222]GKV54730.1 hypothetical protein NCCP2222_06770 [Sporosarcina sp. NCCP-2222]
MKFTKLLRTVIGANLMIILTFAFLPALLINPEFELFQNLSNFISKE